jgi:hypothetical protein
MEMRGNGVRVCMCVCVCVKYTDSEELNNTTKFRVYLSAQTHNKVNRLLCSVINEENCFKK